MTLPFNGEDNYAPLLVKPEAYTTKQNRQNQEWVTS